MKCLFDQACACSKIAQPGSDYPQTIDRTLVEQQRFLSHVHNRLERAQTFSLPANWVTDVPQAQFGGSPPSQGCCAQSASLHFHAQVTTDQTGVS